ncbi:MAG TPA: hypothetical protein VMM13_09085 [Euzebya sp.]|nr:hypothetical protein [Euzebya sp.]
MLLYPRDFRDRYTDDLVQTLTDLSAELGPRKAWRRVTLDLVVTVPRYRLETLMNDERSSTLLTVGIVVMAVAGITSVFVGLYPGVVLVPLAGVVAITQRSKLARSIDAVDGTRLRRKRLRTAAVLAASLPVIYLVSLPILGDQWGTDAVVAFGLWVGVLIAAVCYAIAGISTPKSRATS